MPMDKQAEAGCRNFARLWEPFLEIPIQVEFAEKLKGISLGDSLMVAVATQTPAAKCLTSLFTHSHKTWCGSVRKMRSSPTRKIRECFYSDFI